MTRYLAPAIITAVLVAIADGFGLDSVAFFLMVAAMVLAYRAGLRVGLDGGR